MSAVERDCAARLTSVLLLGSLLAMLAGVGIAVPSGLTLNPADPAAVLAAVHARVELHLIELAFDVIGWLALLAAGLVLAARPDRPRAHLSVLAGGLLAGAGLAGLLHDAGNLAVTQLAADPSEPAAAAVAHGVLLTAKWLVNVAGLLWVAATVAATSGVALPTGLRRAGVAVAVSGAAAVVLPWTTGTAGPSVAEEQFGYLLHLPVMLWWGMLGWRQCRCGRVRRPATMQM
ncbi:hypothetical protein O7623_07830 [Solwaraspora sp. WMMD791]|uniref:hypothetical protein n=1 Tax=Solwaraspora sp. WMMD791 TaxID=3016086 RepID=UPI00249A7989|nr:hypothetical protein [Solwaraspora sp. WMMD791]WFE29082.1 hypothetical protein O7623_07830 [Solwaraspora sp. WMMD791]